MLEFLPTIIRDDQLLELPRPVSICRMHDSWDYLKLKVPRQEGDQISGTSRDGVDIVLEGQVGTQGGELKLSEQTMLETLLLLREALRTDDDTLFDLSLFRDGDLSTHRYFRNCAASRFETDLSSKRIFTYALTIHATDPVLYDGALPG